MKITPEQLQQDLAAVIDPALAKQLVESYTQMRQRYYAGDWQPSELNGGGQFCEAVVRALYQVDTGIVDHAHLPNDMVNQLKSRTPPSPHRLDFKDRDHFCRVLQTTYKFRSDRGVAHVSSTYTANHLD